MNLENQSDLVLVDGATGYLGTHLVQALKDKGHAVRCLVRHNTDKRNLDFLQSLDVEIRSLDYSQKDKSDSKEIFAGVKYAVHLVGSIAPARGETFAGLHQEMTKWWVDNCQKAAVQKAVLVTALGTSENSPSQYHKTKRESEKILQNSSLPHVILRPSLLIGHQVGTRHSKLVKRLIEMVATRPKVPLINGGANKIQPLFIGDMAKCIVAALDASSNDINSKEPIDLAGPQILTLAQLVEKLAVLLDKKVKIAAINPQLGLAVATFLGIVQEVPILSKDQVILAQMDNVTTQEQNGLNKLLGNKGTTLEQSLQTYKNSELLAQVRSK